MLLGGVADLGVHHSVGSEVLDALAGDPGERRLGLHHADRVVERLEVAHQGAGVGGLGEPPAERLGVVGAVREHVSARVGQLKDGLRAEPAVEVVVQQHLRRGSDLVPGWRARGFHAPILPQDCSRRHAGWHDVRVTHPLGKHVHASLLGLLVLGLTTASCVGDDRTDVARGQSARVAADSVPASWDRSAMLTVQVPDGALGVGWTSEADVVDALRDLEGQEFAGADDTHLVAVSVALDSSAVLAPAPARLAVVDAPAPEVALVSGGERTELDVGSLASGQVLVAGVDDASEMALEVTFDGVTQVAGPQPDERQVPPQAQTLYDGHPGDSSSIGCRPASADVSCRAEVTWLPWVATAGWAPEGLLWPVVRVEGSWPGSGGAPTVEATLEGQPALDRQDLGAPDEGFNQLYVFGASLGHSSRLSLTVTDAAGDTVTGGVTLLALR